MKRRLFKLVLFLLLGVIVNVAVAWACARWSSVKQFPSLPQQRVLALLQERQFFPQPDEQYKGGTQEGIGLTVLHLWFNTIVFSRQHPDANQPEKNPWVLAIFAGLPVRSLQAERRGTLYGHYDSFIRSRRLIGGIELGHGQRDRYMLPLRPIWPGFAINTIFYAAILWLLTFGPFTARRMIRHKRGLCIKCGYDLRGTPGGGGACPECGMVFCDEGNR